ncbi:GNAT family N-acetyltransferase [Plantactinospora soyae]|uniref:GNAT superfamily N-acetyltransferase n=1 Tax=Plantactinospora soyae TaxID=1544732 RepID=A0A927M9K0_9ACTN|nr:GNAT family N-acetyltransferase [Plantactinospora soyae]MBE1489440.1 GNAT superfamily N-acetyltransferase [Plantactinospora soyae]
MIGPDAYVENAAAMWTAVAVDAHRDQTCFRAELPRMTRLILRAPMPADGVSRLLETASPDKSAVVEDVFGAGPPESSVPIARVLRMPVMVRPASTVPTVADRDVRIVRVAEPDELAVAERTMVEGFPLPALLPWRRGEALPVGVLGVPGWSVWLAYRHGEAAAAAYTYDDGRVVGLYWLATSPEHRSAGLGRALLTRAVRARPDRPFTLVSTDAGRPLYESLGFRTVATTVWHLRSPARTVGPE